MSSNDCYQQKGIIKNINHGVATVIINAASACSSCESKAACHMTENAEKEIQVVTPDSAYKIGDTVNILMKKSLGMKAAILAYFAPFILILVCLITLNAIGLGEVATGLISLAILIPYFTILYFVKDKLKNTFQFTLNKVS